MYQLNYFTTQITVWVFLTMLQTETILVDAMGMLPISLHISNSGGYKCCSSGGYMMGSGYGGGAIEVFDDGLPLSFYRQQVSKIYGGGGYTGGYMGRNRSRGGYSMSKNNLPSYHQLYKNSFRYPNIMMGGGFMKGDAFGPFGKHLSKKWRGYGKYLMKEIKKNGGRYSEDKLTFVQVVPSGATDEYKDSYLTMIADPMKRETTYNY